MPTDAKRQARIELIAEAAGLDKGLTDAHRKLRRFSRDVDKLDKAGSKKGRKAKSGMVGSGVLGGATALAGAGILDQLTNAAVETRTFEKNLTRLQIASNRTTGQMEGLRSSIQRVSKDTGIARTDILAGTQTYVDLTGDIAGAAAAMETFARTSVATGATVSDVAEVGAALREAGVAAEDFEGVFAGMNAQGKAGAVAFKDFARELSSILPRWAQFNEGTSEKGIATMGAAFQIARKGFGSASEAATGLEALMGSLVTHSKHIKKHLGVDVFDKKGKLKTFDQIIDAMNTSKKAGTKNIASAFGGNKEALQTLDMLRKAKNEATATGNAYDDMVASGLDRNSVERDFRTYMESSSGKLDRSLNQLKLSLAEAFTPERIQAFVKAVEGLAAKLGPVIDMIGTAGNILGKIHGVGQDMREFIKGKDTGNPFKRGEAAGKAKGSSLLSSGLGLVGGQLARDAYQDSIDASDDALMLSASRKALAAAGGDTSKLSPAAREALSRAASSAGYESTFAHIRGAQGADDKSTPEAIRRAVLASQLPIGRGVPLEENAYNIGARTTAGAYLQQAGITPAQQAELAKQYGAGAATASMERYTRAMIEAFQRVGLTVKLDASTVNTTLQNAPAQPPRPR